MQTRGSGSLIALRMHTALVSEERMHMRSANDDDDDGPARLVEDLLRPHGCACLATA